MMPSDSPAARLPADLPVFHAADLKTPAGGGSWGFENLVGILSEISEEGPCGALSFAAEIIVDAQNRNEPVAWVAGTDSVFFPPDLRDRGIDLSALAVIQAGGETDSLTAAEWLLRSKAFGLVIVDVEGPGNVSDGSLGRIQKLADRGQCAVLFLTRKRRSDSSLGSRISLRGCVTRSVARSGAGPLLIDIHTIKDKRSNAASRQKRQYHGPSGMHLH